MFFKSLGGAVLALCIASGAVAADAPAVNPDEAIYIENQRALLNSLKPQFGDVVVPGAETTLHLGEAYYFLGPKDAKRVLTEGWPNPESETSDVLGMIFPAGKSYLDSDWGAVVTFNPEGHVSETDMRPEDFDRVAKAIREVEPEQNKAREQEGVSPLHFVGWAETPSYDASDHSAVWAQELQVDKNPPPHVLNYDVRVLGRRGSLSLNMVSAMDRLAEIKPAAAALRKTAVFDPGARYEDFDPKIDKAAPYGVAGMIAAGAGVLLAKKLGLLALLLVFAKKGVVILIAAFAWLANAVRSRLGLKKKAAPSPYRAALRLEEPDEPETEAPTSAPDEPPPAAPTEPASQQKVPVDS